LGKGLRACVVGERVAMQREREQGRNGEGCGDKTRQDKTRQDKTRQDKTRQDKTRQESVPWNAELTSLTSSSVGRPLEGFHMSDQIGGPPLGLISIFCWPDVFDPALYPSRRLICPSAMPRAMYRPSLVQLTQQMRDLTFVLMTSRDVSVLLNGSDVVRSESAMCRVSDNWG
jgi:hypothetical protein